MNKMNPYTKKLVEAWAKSAKTVDALMADTAIEAVNKNKEVSGREFMNWNREAGFSGSNACFGVALKWAKEGAAAAAITGYVTAARKDEAAKVAEKRAKAAAKKLADAAAAAAAEEKARLDALDPVKSKANAVAKLNALEKTQDALANEILRLTLEFNRNNTALTQGGFNAVDCPVDVNAAGKARLALASEDNPMNGLHAAVIAECKARENAADAATAE